MTDRELDQILGGQPEVEPSSAFAASVMKAVRRETATPPPIGFPWLCIVPGLLACGLVIGVLIAASLSEAGTPIAATPRFWGIDSGINSLLQAALTFLNSIAARWILAALLLTAACIVFPLRLIRGRYR